MNFLRQALGKSAACPRTPRRNAPLAAINTFRTSGSGYFLEGETQMVAAIRQAVGTDRFDQGFAAGVRLNRRQAIAPSSTRAARAPQPPEARSRLRST
jgi:hypothetical protein